MDDGLYAGVSLEDMDKDELNDIVESESSLTDRKKFNLLLENKKIDIFQHLRLNLKNQL